MSACDKKSRNPEYLSINLSKKQAVSARSKAIFAESLESSLKRVNIRLKASYA